MIVALVIVAIGLIAAAIPISGVLSGVLVLLGCIVGLIAVRRVGTSRSAR